MTCHACSVPIPRGRAYVRTTLRGGVLAPVTFCARCRPVVIPAQRVASERVER